MSDINRENLADEFDIENTEVEIETFREVLNKAKELEDPNNVLTSIIDKAGRFLDMVERESVNGAMSARYMEVAAQLVNSMITAANSIATINSTWFNDELKQIRIKQRDRELDQKDKELEIKQAYYNQKAVEGGSGSSQNIIVTDRESIMKFLEGKKQKEVGENDASE